MSIVKVTPLNRCQELIKYDDGKQKYRCYTLGNPHYYKDENGKLQSINVEHNKEIDSGVGRSKLSKQNIASVGIRKDGSATKFLGLRPDETQHLGTEQLEFSLESINFDGETAKIDLDKCNSVDSITTDLGCMLIRSDRFGTRQLFKTNNIKDNFKIEYQIHLKGLNIQNVNIPIVDRVIRKATGISPKLENITDPGALTNFLKRTTKEETVEACFINGVDAIVASPVDMKVDDIPNKWIQFPSLNRGNYCESIYLKDRLHVCISNFTLSESKLIELMIDFLDALTGGPVTIEDKGQSKRIVLKSNVIGSYAIIDNIFQFNIATADHSEVDNLWKSGKQSVDGYYSCQFKNIEPCWKTLTNKYNDLITTTEIKISGKFYEPDINGRFNICNSSGDIVFMLDKPKLLNDKFEIISDNTLHTLELKSGKLYYTKLSDAGCKSDGGLELCSYIDADIIYGSNADGYIIGPSGSWAVTHGAETGDSFNISSIRYSFAASSWGVKTIFGIVRSFFMFDTSGLSISATACELNLYGYIRDSEWLACGVSVQQGTQGDTLSLGDYDAFSGTYFAYKASGSWSQNSYNSFTFNQAGIDAVDPNGTTQICVRDYSNDYLNVAPPESTYYGEGVYYANNTGTTKDPYLEIESGTAYLTDGQRTCFIT